MLSMYLNKTQGETDGTRQILVREREREWQKMIRRGKPGETMAKC